MIRTPRSMVPREKNICAGRPVLRSELTKVRQHPVSGNGLIGGTGRIADETDARMVIAANGGSDLIYLPMRDADLVRKIVAFLTRQDYVDGLFVDDRYKIVAGALPSSKIRLVGSSLTPTPTIAVTFKTFSTDPRQPLMSGVQITDYPLQHGQGMHGSFGRANTFNFMAAIGPDFKKRSMSIRARQQCGYRANAVQNSWLRSHQQRLAEGTRVAGSVAGRPNVGWLPASNHRV